MKDEQPTYLLIDNKLIIDSEELVFDYEIEETIRISGMLIVLLDVPVNIQYNENVFGINIIHKKIIWQIEKLTYPPSYNDRCPFVSIVMYEGQLLLNNWCSTYLVVDPNSGKILSNQFSK